MMKPFSSLATRIRPPANWIIPHLLKRQNTMFVSGDPKIACKSWLLMHLAWSLADGHNLWNIVHPQQGELFKPPAPMRVAYFAQEDTDDDLQDRMMLAAGAGRNAQVQGFFYEPKNLDILIDTESGERMVHSALDAIAPVDLIMFDPMRNIWRGNENDSECVARFWRCIHTLQAKYDCSTIIAHHLTKPSEDAGYSRSSPYAARGSTAIFGGADAFINITPRALKPQPPLERGLFLSFETKRSAPLAPINLRMDFTTGLVGFDGFAA